MSLMMCPKLEESKSPLVKALMIVSESPSKITCFRLSSCAKPITLRVTNTFTISTNVGSGIICVKVAISRPTSFQTTQPRTVKFSSLKVALSKLTFIQSFGGGSQLEDTVALEAGQGGAMPLHFGTLADYPRPWH